MTHNRLVISTTISLDNNTFTIYNEVLLVMDSNLFNHLNDLANPRVERTKRYPLLEILLLVVSVTISGCDGWKSGKDFGDLKLARLRNFLPYADGIPIDDTIARVMRRLDTKQFQQCFMSCMHSISKVTEGEVVSFDG